MVCAQKHMKPHRKAKNCQERRESILYLEDKPSHAAHSSGRYRTEHTRTMAGASEAELKEVIENKIKRIFKIFHNHSSG